MRKLIYPMILAAAVLIMTTCAGPTIAPTTIAHRQPDYICQYDISLHQVERPTEASQRYGVQKITKAPKKGPGKYIFEDEMIQIIWLVNPDPKTEFGLANDISFSLKNKTTYSIKIIWDETAFVDTAGASHRVIHAGVKYSQRNNPQPPSVIVRSGTFSDIVVPSDYISYTRGIFGWRTKNILPSEMDKIWRKETPQAFKSRAKSYVGKTIQILMPLEIQGVVNEYIFIFRVNAVAFKYKS